MTKPILVEAAHGSFEHDHWHSTLRSVDGETADGSYGFTATAIRVLTG